MKTYYVSSGDIDKEIQAESPLEACKQVIRESVSGDSLGRIMKVSDARLKRDPNPWYVATKVAIREAGHTLEITETESHE